MLVGPSLVSDYPDMKSQEVRPGEIFQFLSRTSRPTYLLTVVSVCLVCWLVVSMVMDIGRHNAGKHSFFQISVKKVKYYAKMQGS